MTSATDYWPDALFAAAPLVAPTRLRLGEGPTVEVDVQRWRDEARPEDCDALRRVVGPTLDVGCGPGRHVRTLLDWGHEALGIDVSAGAVHAARRRGAPAVQVSVWGPVPDVGHWQTALLLDGNIGIGGDPVALLRRVAGLLGGARRIIVELSAGTDPAGSWLARVEHLGEPGPWFPWAFVTPDDLDGLAAVVPLEVEERWRSGERYFAAVCVPSAGRP